MPPDSDDSAIWLKGSAGIYHQPPRFVLPLPGLDMMPLKYGLLRSYQTSLGVEIPLAQRFQLTVEGFFNYMDPTIFDLSVNACIGRSPPPTRRCSRPSIVTEIDRADVHRSPHHAADRARVRPRGPAAPPVEDRRVRLGLVHAVALASALRDGAWVPYDFDRTHLVNLVAGLPLRRNWDLGVRLQYQSGKPTTTTAGYNAARTDGYVRFDVRVDKRAVWRKWLLDFYVDVTNVALLPEEVTPGTVIRYVLPTVGLRGRF